MKYAALALSLCLVACGPSRANPCATPGASYLASFAEVSGNCGPIPSQVVNINPDGTVSGGTSMNCAGQSQQGCTANLTDCKWSAKGYDFTMTSHVTFASDGSSASGLASFGASGNGVACSETYQLTYARQ